MRSITVIAVAFVFAVLVVGVAIVSVNNAQADPANPPGLVLEMGRIKCISCEYSERIVDLVSCPGVATHIWPYCCVTDPGIRRTGTSGSGLLSEGW